MESLKPFMTFMTTDVRATGQQSFRLEGLFCVFWYRLAELCPPEHVPVHIISLHQPSLLLDVLGSGNTE